MHWENLRFSIISIFEWLFITYLLSLYRYREKVDIIFSPCAALFRTTLVILWTTELCELWTYAIYIKQPWPYYPEDGDIGGTIFVFILSVVISNERTFKIKFLYIFKTNIHRQTDINTIGIWAWLVTQALNCYLPEVVKPQTMPYTEKQVEVGMKTFPWFSIKIPGYQS